jgi:hypothetical protein
MTVLALAVLGTVGTFAYCVMFGGYVFLALPPIVKAGIEPDNIVCIGPAQQPAFATAGRFLRAQFLCSCAAAPMRR